MDDRLHYDHDDQELVQLAMGLDLAINKSATARGSRHLPAFHLFDLHVAFSYVPLPCATALLIATEPNHEYEYSLNTRQHNSRRGRKP